MQGGRRTRAVLRPVIGSDLERGSAIVAGVGAVGADVDVEVALVVGADIDVDARDVGAGGRAAEVEAFVVDADAGPGRVDPVAGVLVGDDAPRVVVDRDAGAGGVDAISGAALLDDARAARPVGRGGG